MTISWDEAALAAFGDAIEYIAAESYANALSVAASIEGVLIKAGEHPHAHPPDKYRADNDALFRAFEIHHFRISYRIEPGELVVVRFRHTKQQPLQY